jgi:beta-1,4-N-acetylglucosaminyltransferase
MANICLVGSSGGHLAQLLALEEFWKNHNRFWVTFDKPDARSALRQERTYWCYFPTNRNITNLIRNSALAFRIIYNEKPALILSTGAGAAVPYFVLARIFRIPSVFIEVFDRIDSPTLTGRIVYYLATRFYVQWEKQREFYPRAELVGALL